MKTNTIFALVLLMMASALFAQYPAYSFDVGWNLFGGGSSSFSATYIDTLEQIIPPVFFYDTETSGYEAAEIINPLIGYWVLSTDSFTIVADECDCPPTVTDIDGNVYETVLIGDQCWLAENLKVTHYRDGTPISHVTNLTEWEGLDVTETGAYCAYNNDPSNIATYGLLYNWYAVDDGHGLAPEGWHVPTDDEWKELEIYLGMSEVAADSTGFRGTNEGSKMGGRADLWTDGDLETDPEFGTSGMDLLPAGYRDVIGSFNSMSSNSICWSSSFSSTTGAWYRNLFYDYSDVNRDSNYKRDGFSVRCVRD